MPQDGVSLEDLDTALGEVMAEFRDQLVAPGELERAKTRLVADMIYAQDNQTQLARMVGSTLTTGGRLADINLWPERIAEVSAEDIQRVARLVLDPNRAVTGHLLKDAA